MTKLNQIVGLVVGAKSFANKQTAPLFQNVKKGDLFTGLTRRYEPLEDGGPTYANEDKRVRLTVEEVLEDFSKPNSRLVDLILTNESANMEASADVELDGQVLIENAPVTFLMQFQKLLEQEVRGLIRDLPVVDSAYDWSAAPGERPGILQTEEFKQHKTKKIQEPIVLYPATDKHPAQTQLVTSDVLEGYWVQRRFSGEVTAARKKELTERVEKLIAAVNTAREKANDREVTDRRAGAQVFGYLFG